MLLHWSTLHSAGPSNIAALRFSSPVRVRSLCIFPNGAHPFAEQPEIVSETEPEAFVLQIFFNAHPIAGDPKQKPKATNVLVPTSLAYTGGYVNFPVDMGSEFASRLMIVKGDFTKLSMAIYGDVASELPSSPSYHVPQAGEPLSVTPLPLSPALDPANSADPTTLTRSLLSLIPDAPPLPLVIRLMFCLKPANDDWDLPEFPYLHPDLDDDPVDFDLDYVYEMTGQPVADDVPLEVLQRFADRVADAIEPKNDSQSYLVAGILSRVACQHRELPRLLIDRIDIPGVFDSSNMDEDTLDYLLVAAANPDIAKSFTAANLPKTLETVASRPGVDPYVKRAALRVIDRLRSWDALSVAIQGGDLSFALAKEVLRDLGSDEASFGVTLHALVTHPDLAATIAETESLVELRTWVGVACVLAAYAWADSVPNELCRSRAFGIMRVWQSVPRYRETLNHLLLLRQMIFRLECMMEDDTPTRSGIHAEHILYDLTRDPRAFLSPHLTKCLLQLKQGFSVINDAELAALRALALLADDGLPAVLEEIVRTPAQPVSADALRTLRVATVVLAHELETGDSGTGEWATLNALWEQHTHGLPLHLLTALDALAVDAQARFSLIPPPPPLTPSTHPQLANLLAGADELLQVLAQLIPNHPLPSRAANGLVNAAADLFSCADAADTLNSVDSAQVAQGLRGTCIDIVRVLDPELVLRALLRRGTDIAGASAASQDPVRRAHHALSLVDLVLPLEANTPNGDRVRRALPPILPELATFFRSLDVDGRAHLVRRLAELDGGVLGIAEWLVLDELRALGAALRVLAVDGIAPDLWTVKAHQVVVALRLLHDLMCGTAPEALRLVGFVGAEPEPAGLLVVAVNLLLANRAASQEQVELAQVLVRWSSPGTGSVGVGSVGLDRGLCFALGLVFLRAVQHVSPTLMPVSYALDALRQVPIKVIEPDRLSTEMGDALLVLATTTTPSTSASTSSPDGTTTVITEAPAVLSLLEWLVEQSHAGLPQLATLRGISTDTFAHLCDALARALPAARRSALEHVRMHLHTAPEEDAPRRGVHALPQPTADVRIAVVDLLCPSMTPPPMEITTITAAAGTVGAETGAETTTGPTATGQGASGTAGPLAAAVGARQQNALRATTPPHARGVLNMVTVSPPTALLRSPAVTGLTKTYTANDFRALRQTPSARQNTSRLPSTHVDEFQSTMTSPAMVPMQIPVLPANPYGMGLGPPFGS